MLFRNGIIIFFQYISILLISIKCSQINSREELIEYISKKEEVLNIQNEITIEDSSIININSKKISILGSSKNSVIKFVNNNLTNMIFQEDCNKIEIKNIKIEGNFKFINNKNIIFDNVLYNGYFISKNENPSINSTLQILDSEFKLSNQDNGYEIYNYNLDINNSQFYGNDHYNLYLMKYINQKDNFKYLTINGTLFSGNYYNTGFYGKYSEVTITHSKFEKFYSGRALNSGGALNLESTNNIIKSIEFEDNYSESSGGSLYLKCSPNTEIRIISFKNTTSTESGHAMYIYANDGTYKSNVNIYNITQVCSYERNQFSTEGTFMGVSGSLYLLIDTYFGEYLSTGPFMVFERDPIATIKRVNANYIYSKEDGPLVKTYNPKSRGANVSLYVFHINHIIQENVFYSASIISTIGGKIKIDYLYVDDVQGYNSGLIYLENNGVTIMRTSSFKNIYSKWPVPLFYANNNEFYYEPSFYINEFTLSNVQEDGVIFFINSCYIEVHHSLFENIHECFLDNSCKSFSEELNDNFETSIIFFNDINKQSNSTINYCTFDHIYGRMGTNIREGKLEILNSNVTNSYFEKGFLYYTNIWETKGIHILNSMYFANNTSKKGTFLYFDDVVGGDIPIISINKGKFINNTALSYGGIFYSNARKDTYINEYIIFSNCTFENNNALLGKISYIYDDEHGANFNNTDPNALEKLKSDNNNFVSNPTRIIFDNYNITDTIVIHSGDNIDQEYSCSIYDDYENKFEINGDIGEAILDDLVMYELSLKGKYDDSLKSKIYGTSKSYCYNNSCKFKNIRVVGEPGDYLLELKIVSYGQFHEFKQNSISMNVKIIECDEEGYINQDIEGINIKSCYYPTCNPNCVNNGKCINVNVCDCSKTYFKGNTCSERYKQERYRYIDVFFKVSSAIIIIITLIVVIGLHHFRNYENIKAASYDFLNIILVGTIINCVYVILLSKEDYRKIDCIIIYLIKNIAFSLIFGSITTKSYRIYYISKMKRRINSKILNSLKFVPTLTLVCVHIIIFLILILLNMIENVKDIDENEKEYVKCSYSQISKLSNLVNITIILYAAYLAYRIRKMNKKYQEPLSVPIYSYLIYILLLFIMEQVNNNKLIFIFNSGGTLIYSLIILIFLFFLKFYYIYIKEVYTSNLRLRRMSVSSQRRSSTVSQRKSSTVNQRKSSTANQIKPSAVNQTVRQSSSEIRNIV